MNLKSLIHLLLNTQYSCCSRSWDLALALPDVQQVQSSPQYTVT